MTPAEILGLSAERDRQLELRLAAWRDGYATAAAQFADWEARGYACAVADVKAAQHALVNHVRGLPADAGRWVVRGEPRTRRTFGDPHPGDFGGEAA